MGQRLGGGGVMCWFFLMNGDLNNLCPFNVFQSFSTMRAHAQTCVRWSKYTTFHPLFWLTTHSPLLRKASRSNPGLLFQTVYKVMSLQCVVAWQISAKNNCILLVGKNWPKVLNEPIFRNDLTLMIWYHLRALLFNFLVCLFLGYYFKCLVMEDSVLMETNWWWLEVLAIVRTTRWIWQNTVRLEKK